MLKRGVEIVGIETCTILRGIEGGDVLMLRLVLSDGSTGATHWHLDSMREFVYEVAASPRRPIGVSVQ